MMVKQDKFQDFYRAVDALKGINPIISGRRSSDGVMALKKRDFRLQKVLVANRGEIAKRFFLALHEEGIPSVAVVTEVDRGQSWYEFADEVIFIGNRDNYADKWVIIAALYLSKANALYSGYGFLSESPEFVETLDLVSRHLNQEILFMGPHHSTMRMVGDKINARNLAREAEIPLFMSSELLRENERDRAFEQARAIGFPLMIKLSAGGGGKGMQAVNDEDELADAIESISRIGRELYRDTSFYLEEYIRKPVHIEVQIFNSWAIGIRKCAVQRRNQKIIEESGHTFLDDYVSLTLLAAAEKIAAVSGYNRGGGAGTVEFLIDQETGRMGFIEVNTRLQVEYAVTDQSLGIDLAKWQILFYDGRENEIFGLDVLKSRMSQRDHSIECRIYAEEPENNYLPSPGMISVMDLPTFNGIRCDFGFSEGDSVLSMYDPLIGKIIAHGATRKEAIIRMERALQELYIKGVKTNINQLLRIVRHEAFVRGDYTNNLLAEHAELNFSIGDEGGSDIHDRRKKKQVIFGAFTEYIHAIQRSVRGFLVIANIESIIDSPVVSDVPSRFILKYQGDDYTVEFIQTAIDTFIAYVNGVYNGRIIVISVNVRSDDFLLIFGNSSYRLRINRYADYIDIRMRGDDNKINYYRVSVKSDRAALDHNIQAIRSPFQGTFIGFCRDDLLPGARVECNEPLIVLSSMKMETTLNSPCSGKILEVIENGDLSRLHLAKTPDGRIIGKSIQENELLVKIETDAGARCAEQGEGSEALANPYVPGNRDYGDLLFSDAYNEYLNADPLRYFDGLLELLYAAIRGMIYQAHLIDRVVRSFRQVLEIIDFSLLADSTISRINATARHYGRIKRLFSPVLIGEGLSFPQELSQYIQNRSEGEEKFSEDFRVLLNSLLEAYGLSRWEGRSDVKKMFIQHSFVLFKRSYQFCLDRTDVIKDLVFALSAVEHPADEIYETLNILLTQEESEKDDSLLKFIRKTIEERFKPGSASASENQSVPGSGSSDIQAFLGDDFDRGIVDVLRKSLEFPEQALVPDSLHGAIPNEIIDRISILSAHRPVRRLYSPFKQVVPYIITNKDSPCYCAFTWPVSEKDSFEDIKGMMEMAARLVSAYHLLQPGSGNWVDLTLYGVMPEHDSCDPGMFLVHEYLKNLASGMQLFFDEGLITRAFFHFDRSCRLPMMKSTAAFLYKCGTKLCLDVLQESDRGNPYFNLGKTSLRDQRLFNTGKWPVEVWAAECLDPGSINEIIIESIDGTDIASRINPMTGMRPVGAKIFHGTIDGKAVCFYMKDSRVSGGSTGSREGLKYIAAVYLSYLKDWPLYVWNDSAGANIGEGVVSLNRGAEGFMMNSLVVQRADADKFRKYTRSIEDPEVRDLFQELNSRYNLSVEALNKKNRSFILAAVGIGSSAGLDVYGSSQATVQILLDSDHSYRVLTGSNVIRTVIGENITNYDIGGAKILGTWTGIVDVVAADKLHMISIIRDLQRLFCHEETLPCIRRSSATNGDDTGGIDDLIVFKESIVKQNVDDKLFRPFKKDYYASEALIGGFAKLGGRRVLIMGPRTNFGLRSIASIIRARELVKMAERTGTPQIFVYGKKWLQTPDYHENISMRSRLDFIKTMQIKSGVRIHIITHVDGLKLAEITGNSDAIIFVLTREPSDIDLSFIRQNSSFIVSSMDEAFDLACRLIQLIGPISGEHDRAAGTTPSIPMNSAEPYDIVASVIEPVFDAGSFVEFFREMNNPVHGPHLVTGLALLKGRTVGVIADQPLVKGGGADAFGTEKFRVFTEFLNSNAIPLVMLSNSSGFVPGSQQERYRIQAIGAESLDANILGEIPVVSVVLNQNYGGRLIHAFNKFLRPGIVYLALDRAVMAVIGSDAAFELIFGKKYARLCEADKKDEAEKVRADFIEGYLSRARASNDALATGLVDWLIHDIAELRQHLIRGMNRAFQRCREAFGHHWEDI